MNWLEIAIPVLALSGLCAGWMLVQILARRLGTKNHLEQKPGCGNCRCYGGPCEREMQIIPEDDPAHQKSG